ncbi:MAG: hypothetical protein ACYTFI_09345 [Planctomycetota bacterium]|jgi:hypothetical protein
MAKTKVKDGVLWVYSSDPVIEASSIPTDPEFFRELHAEREAGGCVGIIVDVRGVELDLSWPAKIEFALAIAKGRTPGSRVAVLADASSITTDGDFERIAGLAAALVRVFSDEQKALAWVKAADPGAERPPSAG